MKKSVLSSHLIPGSRCGIYTAVIATFVSAGLPLAAPAQSLSEQQAERKEKEPQKEQPATGNSKVQQLQTTIVTASRRKEMARDVPLQIDRLSTEELEQSGAKSLSDYLGGLPAVDVKTQGGAGLGAISIRGVSTGDQTIATVGTYIDDIAVGSYSPFVNGPINALDMALLDLNHIELMRGPQGTLYGAGAMGGVLKYVTNEPDTQAFEGWARVATQWTQGGALGNTVSGLINVPVHAGTSAFRIAAFSDKAPGYVTAVGPAQGSRTNGGDSQGIRLSGLVEPSKNWRLRMSAIAQDLHRDGLEYVDYDPTTRTSLSNPTTRSLSVQEPYTSKIRIFSAELEADLGFARLNSTTSTQRITLGTVFDTTPAFGPLVGPMLASNGISIASTPTIVDTVLNKTTQEFRLTSDAKRDVSWLAGLYYDREEGTNDQRIGTTLIGGGSGPDLIKAALPSKFEEVALFGDVTWNMSPRLATTIGARVSRNKQTFRQIADGVLTAPSDMSSDSSEMSTTYLLTTKYATSPTSNIYARIASGYRPGGPNVVVLDPDTGQPSNAASFKSDSLWSYEAGYKTDLQDQRLSLQTTVYQIRWNDIQQYVSVQGLNVLTNAGKAEINGVEASLTYRPFSDWRVATSVAYTDARLVESGPGLGSEGSQLPNQAKWSFNLSSRYDFAISGHAAYVGASLRGVGSRDAGFEGSASLPSYRLPGYVLADAMAGITVGKIDIGLSVRNLFDNRAQMSAQTNFVPLGSPVYVVEARPRTVTLSLTVPF